MCPIYQYIHPETKEIFEDIRSFQNADNDFIAPDGIKCERVKIPSSVHGWRSDREVFEVDPSYVKKCKPKYIRYRNGYRERYDPTKHC